MVLHRPVETAGVMGNFDPGESMQTTHKSPTHLSMEWIAYKRLDAPDEPNGCIYLWIEETA
jgi:hypothetical protein